MTTTNVEHIDVPATCRVSHTGHVLPNGVRVIVVTDPTTKKSACAASMYVGSHRDPPDAPGLAHLCEHMLFLGTKSFPEEGGFDKFLSGAAGHTNAYTTDSMTCYYYEASTADNKAIFAEALDRFAGFFSEPAMTAAALEREVQAVHSEDEKNHSVAYWRTDEIKKLHLVDKRHPNSRYGNGNASTLCDGPKKKGLDLHQMILRFYDEYYSAENLVLAVYSPLSSDEVLQILRPNLEKVKQTGRRNENTYGPDALTDKSTIWSPGVPGSWVNVKTSEETQRLTLLFPLKTSKENSERYDTSHFLSWMIGHECKGTPADVLRELDYVTALSTSANGVDDDNQIFQIALSLTAKGLAEIDKVIDLVFDGISFFKHNVGADTELFADMVASSQLAFNLSELRAPASHVTSLCRNGNEHGLRRAWSGLGAVDELNAAEVMQMFDALRPERAVYMLHHPDCNGMVLESLRAAGNLERAAELEREIAESEKRNKQRKKEEGAGNNGDDKGDEGDEGEEEEEETAVPSSDAKAATKNRLPVDKILAAQVPTTIVTEHHGANFGMAKIDDAVLQRWARDRTGQWCALFRRPKTNPFLSSEFRLVTAEGIDDRTWGESQEPKFLSKADSDAVWGRVMWRPDAGMYQTPRAAVMLEIETPAAYADPKSRFFSRVLADVIKYATMETTYFAELAGYEIEIDSTFRGLAITAGLGPRHKLLTVAKTVIEKIIDEILGGETCSNQTKYLDCADKTLRDLISRNITAPYSQAMETNAQFYYGRRFSHIDILDSINSKVPPFAEFLEFARSKFLARLRYDMLVAGNATEADAQEMADFMQNSIIKDKIKNAKSASPDEFLEACTVLPLPSRKELRAAPSAAAAVVDDDTRLFGSCLSRRSTNLDDGNCSAVAQFHMGPASPRTNALSKLVVNLLRSMYFESLRTRETIGYIVSLSSSVSDQDRFVMFVAQSAKCSAFYILSRTYAFLEAAAAYLGPRSASDAEREPEDPLAAKIDKASAALVAEARDKPKNLRSFVARVWGSRYSKFGFDRLEEEAKLLEDKSIVNAAAVRAFFAEHFLDTDAARVLVGLCHGSEESEKEITAVVAAPAQQQQQQQQQQEASSPFLASIVRQLPPCVAKVPEAGKDMLVLPTYNSTEQQETAAQSVKLQVVTSRDEWRQWRKSAMK